MRTFVFPGQGSQAKGMGKLLFDRYREQTELADSVLGYSIRTLCLDDPHQQLNQTQFTQPAIYVVNALSCLAKIEQFGMPDYVAGHSLGEFNALTAAGCFDFGTGLKLVRRRAELMGQAAEGAMAAIINATPSQIEQILRDHRLDEIDIANFNTPSQIVISGSKAQIARAQEYFQQDRMQFIALNTSGAFHSRFMAPAAQQFADFLRQFAFQAPRIPVIANVSARPYQGDEVMNNLTRQITGSVRWTETVEYLLNLAGRDENGAAAMQFVEAGHGDVLTKMGHKIRTEWLKTAPLSSPVAPMVDQAATSRMPARERVQEWNRKHVVGTRVKSAVLPGQALETRTEALLLFQHRAAVYLKGYSGYFDLEELVAL